MKMKKVPEAAIAAALARHGLASRDLHTLASRMITYDGHPLLVVGDLLFYAPVRPTRAAEPAGAQPRRRVSDTCV